MIREIIRPKTNQVVINIPQNLVDKDLELIVFEIEQDSGTNAQKFKFRQLMDDIFRNAESVIMPDDLDIDDIMNGMNNALS